MDATVDELAGVVDLFGGLTRAELERALAEAAFREGGQSLDDDAFDAVLEAALDEFGLVRFEPAGRDQPLYVAGPTAFPSTPPAAEDLPHILALEPRPLDRAALGEAAAATFRDAVDEALETDDADRLRDLLEVSYDLETWAPLDLGDERERLASALE
ncbi:DUF7109 family protein [Natronobiforma cellulositropha]|uniref:DUF7109 family protein n=1 Tax=Natronobiforma cellulositropha TaxID=1679076 RepID=UPI0021D6144B|nr:hypothetical protein [Natronobiforma cellulositropha]